MYPRGTLTSTNGPDRADPKYNAFDVGLIAKLVAEFVPKRARTAVYSVL